MALAVLHHRRTGTGGGLGGLVLVDIDRGDKAVLRKFDGFGALLLAVSLGSLQYVLHEGPRLQWLDDGTVKALLLATAVAGALLLWRCLRRPAAILDLGVFRDRNFTIGCLFNVALGAGLFVGDYLMTQYLGRVRGLNSQQIGETLLVTGAFEVLGAPVSLWLATRVDPRIVLGLGYALFGSGLYLATGMTADWDFDELFWSQAVRGFSLMLCFVPVTGLALGTLPATAGARRQRVVQPDAQRRGSGRPRLGRHRLAGPHGAALRPAGRKPGRL